MPARARQFRQRSIRELLSLIVVVPSFCLLALWVLITAGATVSAVRAQNFVTAEGIYAGPAQSLYSALEAERLQAFVWLSGGRQSAAAPLLASYRQTNRAATGFLAAVTASRGAIPAAATSALAGFDSALASRATVRAGIASGQLTATAAIADYDAIVAAEFDLDARLIVTADGSTYRQAEATVQAGRAVELASQELVLLHGAAAAGGTMSAAGGVQFAQDVAGQRLLFSAALGQLEPSLSAGYLRLASSRAYQSFAALENQVVGSAASPGPVAVTSASVAAADPVIGDYQAAALQAQSSLTALAVRAGRQHVLAALLIGVLGLAAVGFSMGLMIRFGLLASRELIRLRDAALGPAADLQLSASQSGAEPDDDSATASTPDQASPILEIASIGAALSAVRSKAAQAEADHAELRGSTRQAVLTLAERSQALLARHQALVDGMRRPPEGPATVVELSAVEQLTAPMRRHSDDLLVLSGGSPGRSWSQPVPISDLLAVVAADVADIATVSVLAESTDDVTSAATADLVHLIGELVVGAAQHTPPDGEITIRAGRVGRGVAVEIEDRGAALTAAELERVNAIFASPPEFDLVETDRVGFVIAARLAAKHRITVTLRAGPLGGTSTILVLPHALLVADGERDTIIDGSLPRVDPGTQRAAARAQQTGLPAAFTEAQADSRVAPYVAPDEPPAAAKPAPWYWLTASPPAPLSPMPDQPLSTAGSQPNTAPLPRRNRQPSSGPSLPRRWPGQSEADEQDDS